jgi:hypothetical protein
MRPCSRLQRQLRPRPTLDIRGDRGSCWGGGAIVHPARCRRRGRGSCVEPSRHGPSRARCPRGRDNEGPKRRTREGGSQWEPIKILLEGYKGSNKMNTASNTRLRLNNPSWPRPRSHWNATGPRNQHTAFRTKTHEHTQRKLARLVACATPVKPMACAGQTGDTGQTGGQSQSGW